MKQSDWEIKQESMELDRQPTLTHANTADVADIYSLLHLDSAVIGASVKAPEGAINEIKTWLRTGTAPDGTRMMTDKNWQWKHDVYHVTSASDKHEEYFSKDFQTDYYYWSCPYNSHIGEIKLIMMQAQVNGKDNTHFSADRLHGKVRKMKNLPVLAKKRAEVAARNKREFIERAMDGGAHRDHPLRKKGIYTKYFYRGPNQESGSPNQVPVLEVDPTPIRLEPSED